MITASPTLDLASRLDPVMFARRAGIEPDWWQQRLLRSQSPRVLMNCSRQSGKSLMSAVIALHTAIYTPDSPVLLLSPSLRQSMETFRKCLDVYRALGRPVKALAENTLHLELENGSRILSLPGTEKTVRGISGVRLLVEDESARCSDELYNSCRPMLAVSGGRLILLSTPFGTRGHYHEAWRHWDDWDYYEVPASSIPRIPPEFLEEEQRVLGQWWYQQEYCCKFMDAAGSAFRAADIEAIYHPEEEVWSL